MRNQYRFARPPRGVRRRAIQFNNFSLVPASLLSDIAEWQTFTDRQPEGTAVLVLLASASPLRRVYAAVARVLKADGKHVKLYSVHHPDPPRSTGHVRRAQHSPTHPASNR